MDSAETSFCVFGKYQGMGDAYPPQTADVHSPLPGPLSGSVYPHFLTPAERNQQEQVDLEGNSVLIPI